MKKEYINLKDNIIDFIKKVVELNEDYVVNGDIIHRFNKKYKLEDYIEMVLENFPDGLHYSELNKILKKDYNLDYTDTQILNGLGHYGFKNIGLGTYTLNSNNNYSGGKTGDIIYLYLKDEGEPKTLKDITNHVLSRKKINEGTVIAAISGYKTEMRFVFYNDRKIGLKEWNLGNVREKREGNLYKIPLSNTFDILKAENLIPDYFTQDDFGNIMIDRFGCDVSSNRQGIYNVLSSLVKKGLILSNNNGNKNIYSLIK